MGLASLMPGLDQSCVPENPEMLGHCWLGYTGVIGQDPHGQFPLTAKSLEKRPTCGVSKSREDISRYSAHDHS